MNMVKMENEYMILDTNRHKVFLIFAIIWLFAQKGYQGLVNHTYHTTLTPPWGITLGLYFPLMISGS